MESGTSSSPPLSHEWSSGNGCWPFPGVGSLASTSRAVYPTGAPRPLRSYGHSYSLHTITRQTHHIHEVGGRIHVRTVCVLRGARTPGSVWTFSGGPRGPLSDNMKFVADGSTGGPGGCGPCRPRLVYPMPRSLSPPMRVGDDCLSQRRRHTILYMAGPKNLALKKRAPWGAPTKISPSTGHMRFPLRWGSCDGVTRASKESLQC